MDPRVIQLARRAETFGYGTDRPWAADALRLVFSVARTFEPLATAWDGRHPGTRAALDRLTADGWLAYQPAVVIDTRTAELTENMGRPVARYRLSARGRKALVAVREDTRVLHDHFPRLTKPNAAGVLALLSVFDLSGPHAKIGASVATATARSGLAPRTARWWVRRWTELGWLKECAPAADQRAVIPAHWRPTSLLAQQLRVLIKAGLLPASTAVEFRLDRSRYLRDIDPARLGATGATDYDHDVQAQLCLAHMVRSPKLATTGVFVVEPRIDLPLTGDTPGRFVDGADGLSSYMPDAEYREADQGRVSRSVLEYERFQSRRAAWGHIERFLGWLHLHALPGEPAVLRFIVDSNQRVASYVELIEAFSDYAIDNTDKMPANPVLLAVSSVERLAQAADPLDNQNWFRISVPTDPTTVLVRTPVLHPAEKSPYDQYFSRRS